MNKKEMIERSRRALADFDRLSPAQQVKELVASGAIDEEGEVLLGRGQEPETRTAEKTTARDHR